MHKKRRRKRERERERERERKEKRKKGKTEEGTGAKSMHQIEPFMYQFQKILQQMRGGGTSHLTPPCVSQARRRALSRPSAP